MSKKSDGKREPEGVFVESGLESTIHQEGLKCVGCHGGIEADIKPMGYYPRQYAGEPDEKKVYSGFMHPGECTESLPPGMVMERMTITAKELTELVKVRMSYGLSEKERLLKTGRLLGGYLATAAKHGVELGVLLPYMWPAFIRRTAVKAFSDDYENKPVDLLAGLYSIIPFAHIPVIQLHFQAYCAITGVGPTPEAAMVYAKTVLATNLAVLVGEVATGLVKYAYRRAGEEQIIQESGQQEDVQEPLPDLTRTYKERPLLDQQGELQ